MTAYGWWRFDPTGARRPPGTCQRLFAFRQLP